MDLAHEIQLRLNIIKERGLTGFIRSYLRKINNIYQLRMLDKRGNIVYVDNLKLQFEQAVVSDEIKLLLLNGDFELDERIAAKQYIDPSLPVIELGGFIGVLACITNRMLSDPKRHFVVEANPNSIQVLTQNRDENNCQFEIIHGAISYSGQPTVKFNLAGIASSLSTSETDGSVEVQAIKLSDIVEDKELDKFTLMCDIEGAESKLITNEIDLLAAQTKLIIIEVHSNMLDAAVVQTLLNQLDDAGFAIVNHTDLTYVFENQNLK